MRQRPCKYTDIPFCVVFGTLSLSESDMFISVPTGSLVKSAEFFFCKFPLDMDRLCQPNGVSEMYFKRQHEAKYERNRLETAALPHSTPFRASSHLGPGGGQSCVMKCKPRMPSLTRWSCAQSDGNLMGI